MDTKYSFFGKTSLFYILFLLTKTLAMSPNFLFYCSPTGMISGTCSTPETACSFNICLSNIQQFGENVTLQLLPGNYPVQFTGIFLSLPGSVLQGTLGNPADVVLTFSAQSGGRLFDVDRATVQDITMTGALPDVFDPVGLGPFVASNSVFNRVVFEFELDPIGQLTPAISTGLTTFNDCIFQNSVLDNVPLIFTNIATFNRCTFQNNTASSIIFNSNTNSMRFSPSGQSELTLDGCSFFANVGSVSGGIQSTNQTVLIQNSIFSDNIGQEAGCLYLDQTNMNISQSSFQANLGFEIGGAIHMASGLLHIVDSLFDRNALAGIGDGAAIAVETGDLLVDACTFQNHLISSLFAGSSAFAGRGGAIFTRAQNTVVTHSLFLNNSVGPGEGSGLFAFGGVLQVSHTVFLDGRGNGAVGLEDGSATLGPNVSLQSDLSDIFASNEELFLNDLGFDIDILITGGLTSFTQINANISINILILFGTLELNGDIIINESFNWTGNGGSVRGAGSLTFGPNSISEWGLGDHLVSVDRLINLGTLSFSSVNDADCLAFESPVLFENFGTASFEADCIFRGTPFAPAAQFINMGVFRPLGIRVDDVLVINLTTTGTTVFRFPSSNTGGIRIQDDRSIVVLEGRINFERIFPFFPNEGDTFSIITASEAVSSLPPQNFDTENSILNVQFFHTGDFIQVQALPTPIQAGNDQVQLLEDQVLVFNPLENDFSLGGAANFISVSDPSQFSFDPATSLLTFTPQSNLNGNVSFTYTVA